MNDEVSEAVESPEENAEEQTQDAEATEEGGLEEGESEAQNQEDSEENEVEDSTEDSSLDDQPAENDSSDSDSPEPAESFEPDFKNDILNDYIRRCLEPIEGNDPCGESDEAASSVISQIETTGDGIHESLRTAFGESVRDDSPTSFDMSSVGRDADGLVDQIVDCLEEKSKSLLLAVYLPHLLLIPYGPEGFAAGLTIVRELLTRYPNQIHPRDEEKLSGFLRRGVYIGNDDKVTDNYKLFLYLPVTENDNLPYALLRNAKLKGAGGDIEGRYAADATRSSVDFYVELIGGLDRACQCAQEANAAIGSMLDDNTFEIVSFQFIESVQRMASIVGNLATTHCSGYPPVEEEESEESSEAEASPAQIAASGEIVDREHAIKMLGKIADFFYKTEKHSPISYRIRDTIKWCQMDFPELLNLLLAGDENSLSEMQKRVGFESLSSDED